MSKYMIQQDNYILYCLNKENPNGEFIIPIKNEINSMRSPFTCSNFITDYIEAEKYIKNELGLKYSKIFICKIIDCVEPTLIKTYEKNND
jgi:hypothetical protein